MKYSKKYLTEEFIILLAKGIIKYESHKDILGFIPSVKKFLKTNNIRLTRYFKSDIDEYIKTLDYIIQYIDVYSLTQIKQEILNLSEKSGEYVVHQMKSFLDKIFDDENLNISLMEINKEWRKIIKYILIKDTIKSLEDLEGKYFVLKDVEKEVEVRISKLFERFDNTMDARELVADSTDNIGEILDELTEKDGELREFRLFKEYQIAQTRRVITIIGPSGLGKSMLLCAVAGDYITNKKFESENEKKIVFYFTAENTREETLNRIIANVTDIPINDVKKIKNNPELKKEIIKRWKERVNKNFILAVVELEAGVHTTLTFIKYVNKYLKKYPNSKPFVIIADYVERFRSLRGEDRRNELGEIINDFKNISIELDLPVYTAAQLNRQGVKKVAAGKDPDITDVGESWKIIENSDVAIILEGDLEGSKRRISFNFKKHRYYENGRAIHGLYIPSKAKFIVTSKIDKTVDEIENDINDISIDAPTLMEDDISVLDEETF